MNGRYFSVHAHFYQPPREDPLTGLIPPEGGANPYPNWNEKIHSECYRPNAELGNFANISFNVGPTLCSWMHQHDPRTCNRIVEQDRSNVERFGVGNAMAQAYNHTILPLASYEDKVTQVVWGISDFTFRFGRKPRGMWLPETAADTETLDVLAQHGIAYTILAPWQAEPENTDITEPYLVRLPGKRQIAVFFYHRELSTRISFDPSATTNADLFAGTILRGSFNPRKEKRGEPQLILMASDGELYGHHQALRDHFLEHLVNGASATLGLQHTYPARWLKQYPPRQSIHIQEATSWSCHHGVERWRDTCACTPGPSLWKRRMRHAFDCLAEQIDQAYLDLVQPHIANPWTLRNRYIHVMLGEMHAEDLINEMAGSTLPSDTVRRIHLMLEAQRERQRMYTSCGWFFDDYDRIEPRNNTAYLAQAVALTKKATGVNLQQCAGAELSLVRSENSSTRADTVFERHLRRAESFLGQEIGFAS